MLNSFSDFFKFLFKTCLQNGTYFIVSEQVNAVKHAVSYTFGSLYLFGRIPFTSQFLSIPEKKLSWENIFVDKPEDLLCFFVFK